MLEMFWQEFTMMEMFWTVYGNIGPAGMVLIFFAVYGLYLSIRNLIYIYLVRRDFRKNYNKVFHDDGVAFASEYQGSNPLLSIMWEVVRTHSDHSDDIRAEVGYLFYRNFESVSRSLYWMRLITVVSPLLGLLGTVMGMVEVFQAIAAASNPDPSILASGIWEALLTTVLGLSVAIPMLMLYYFLLLRFKGFHIEAIEYSYRVLKLTSKAKVRNDVEV